MEYTSCSTAERIDQAKEHIALEISRACKAQTHIIKSGDAAWQESCVSSPHGVFTRLYGVNGACAAVIRSCGTELCAFTIDAQPSDGILTAVEGAMRQSDKALRTLTGVHPDVYLAENDDERYVFCLFIETKAIVGRERACLFDDVLRILDVRSFYRLDDGDAFLFAVESSAPLARLGEILSEHGAKGGFCGPYERAASARGSLCKSRMAADFSKKGELKPFSECRYDAFWTRAASIAKDMGFVAQDLCDEALLRVMDYDKREHTAYADSLCAYLDSGRSLREAACAVGVHRNTMAYRIKRIGELFGIDTENDATCFELQFSFRIAHYLPSRACEGRARFFAPDVERALWAALHGENTPFAQEASTRLIVIDIVDMDDDGRNALIKRLNGNRVVAFDDDMIYVAVSSRDDEFINTIKRELDEHELRAVLSQVFPCNRISLHIRLTRMLLLYARSYKGMRGLMHANDFCSTLFYLFLHKRMELVAFCCDEVVRVMDHDYFQGTSLSTSLYAYLTHYANLKGAAKETRIHRNTMDYQIKKVIALLGKEPMDGRLRFEMICAYRIFSTTDTPCSLS